MLNSTTMHETLIAWRMKSGLSRQQLGKRIRVSPRTIESWEQGLRAPRLKRLKGLAKALGCQPADLLA